MVGLGPIVNTNCDVIGNASVIGRMVEMKIAWSGPADQQIVLTMI